MSTHSESHGSDMKAGFLGLIIGAIVVFAILLSIVKLTNNHYAHEAGAQQQQQTG